MASGLAAESDGAQQAGATVRAAAPAARFVFRGRDAAVGAAGSALGTPLPLEPCRA